ncbi:hypothetical protein TNCV_1855531 [Trichonephila clavipes]|nr:hypothetical protein TNCV_1855531 [Trichonephila clavipes]
MPQRNLLEFMVCCIIGRMESGQTQRTVMNVVRVPRRVTADCGMDSEKQGMFDVGQDKVVHQLPQQIMTYISYSQLRDRTVNAKLIQRQFHLATGQRVSNQTIRKRLHENGGSMVWAGIFIGGRTDQHINRKNNLTAERLCIRDREPMSHRTLQPLDTLKRRVTAIPIPHVTIQDLEIILRQEWNSIPQSLVDNLIASMQNMRAIVTSSG